MDVNGSKTNTLPVLKWFANVVAGIALLVDFIPVIFAVGVTAGIVLLLNEIHPIDFKVFEGLRYSDTYTTIAAASFTFPTIAIAINIWKQSGAESRLVAQAASLRDYFLNLAEALEGRPPGETPGTIDLKGIAETIDQVIYAPARFDCKRLDVWVKSLAQHPEVHNVRPAMLFGTQNIGQPLAQIENWRSAVAAAVNFAIYAALVSITLELFGDRGANVYGMTAALISLCIALRATVRLIL